MADHGKIAKNLERFAQAVEAIATQTIPAFSPGRSPFEAE